MSRVRHILTILAVTDLERSTDFYKRAFGWPVRVNSQSYVEFALDSRGIGLYERQRYAKNTEQLPVIPAAGDIVGVEIYLHCDDLEVTMARLEQAGARLLSGLAARDWGDEVAYYADPDGTVLAVARPLAIDDDI